MPKTKPQTSHRVKVLWVAPSLTQAQDPIQVSSPKTSVRLRCLEIIRFLKGSGFGGTESWQIDVELICGQTAIVLLNAVHSYEPDLVIFGTLVAPLAPAILQLHVQGMPIAMDLSEDMFDCHDLRHQYLPLLSLGLNWIAASDFLYDRLLKKSTAGELSGALYVIKEPPEGLPSRTTRMIHAELGRCESRPLELAWIGENRHLEALCDFLDTEKSLHSTIVVVIHPGETLKKLKPYLEPQNSRHRLHLVQWSLENQRNAIMKAHGTLIPCGGDGALAESAHRLITSLWFGTPVVAHPIPSFRPFAPFSHQHSDLAQAIEGLLSSHWDKTENEVLQGQRFIQTHFNIDIIGEQWRAAIIQMANKKRAP